MSREYEARQRSFVGPFCWLKQLLIHYIISKVMENWKNGFPHFFPIFHHSNIPWFSIGEKVFMIGSLIKKIVGSKNERELKRIQPVIQRINELEPTVSALSDDQLRAKTAEFKERIQRGESIEEILPETFAVVREAGKRTLGERHYDVQLIGGVVLHE